MTVKITVRPNGPYLVEGPIELVKGDGTPIETHGERIFLCRCGHSEHKPICDSTHKKIEFKAD